MPSRETIRSITYLKSHAADILATVRESRGPVIITHNGEGKMVIQDIESYQAMREAIALLKIVAQGRRSVDRGRTRPAAQVLAKIERRRKGRG